MVVDLAWAEDMRLTLTVAGQRRTLTGFAFKPGYPDLRVPLLGFHIQLCQHYTCLLGACQPAQIHPVALSHMGI